MKTNDNILAFMLLSTMGAGRGVSLKRETMEKVKILGYVLKRIHPTTGVVTNGFPYGVYVNKLIRPTEIEKFKRRLKRLHKEKHVEILFVTKSKLHA